ncbi:ABC transporter ATP-binding protein [Alteraurantiacibacter aquimixticola]|uniref:ABC transporter ATP-binding protein n=1 Tax=Alteraurantiacibacter aquimixticola TaxID=2489173 RepID=UPI001FE33A1D|nr:ATP-binding cassette domain-containing protein [Alteraurantiacibacter aquimixticola]
MNALLQIDEVSHDFGGPALFHNFSMTLPMGGQCLLVGPSGSGKSTLINLICGFLKPRSGEIRIAGEAISQGAEAARDAVRKRHVAVVFQSLRLVSALSVAGNLQLAARLAGRAASQTDIALLLDELGIGEKANARPHQLSQGQAQRAAVARALIARPSLLIADEPTSALDDANAARVADMLLRLASDHGTGLLVATHDVRLRPFFDKAIALEGVPA